MESGERNEVDGQLSEVRVELSRESKAAGNSRDGSGDEVVKISICWGCQLEGSEADVIKGLVINDLDLISVFNKLMD